MCCIEIQAQKCSQGPILCSAESSTLTKKIRPHGAFFAALWHNFMPFLSLRWFYGVFWAKFWFCMSKGLQGLPQGLGVSAMSTQGNDSSTPQPLFLLYSILKDCFPEEKLRWQAGAKARQFEKRKPGSSMGRRETPCVHPPTRQEGLKLNQNEHIKPLSLHVWNPVFSNRKTRIRC